MAIHYKVLSSMDIEVQRQESIAKNLAGAPIPGYKGESVISSDFDGYLNQFDATGQGAAFEKSTIDYNAGPVKHTGRPLDFAIAKDGFFEVTTSDGQAFYTRNGRFTLSPDGKLITSEGYEVAADRGNISFGEDVNVSDLAVSSNGKLSVGGEEIGQLKIVQFKDLNNLERMSSSYFKLNDEFRNEVTTMEPGKIKIMGRTLEQSNISIVKEMITMIDSMRKFEMAQKLMKAADGLKTKELSTFG
ncbi:MAG: flagellar hook basal-body protein [Lentisphaeraceae bacterium]|nr:flagellar hook basal-body protein [Lentisphaeraceae bacterium]